MAKQKANGSNGANIGYEAQLWQMADLTSQQRKALKAMIKAELDSRRTT